MSFVDRDASRDRKVLLFIGLVVALATVFVGLLIIVQRTYFFSQSNWAVFGLFSVFLVLGETRPSFTMRFGDSGEVSPGYTFAFALMLFGMPIGAIAVMTLSNLWSGLRHRSPARMLIFNLSQIALAMSAGALVLQAFGLRGALTDLDEIPVKWAAGILCAGGAMLILNVVLTAIVIGLHTGTGFVAQLRAGLALSMTADGALLSLAPVFVIAVDYSFVLIPLLATTSYIVIRSARSALLRAHEASHDSLTGLLNRRAFDDRLAKAVGTFGSERDAVVLVMDFDGFKEINDSLGHGVGDALLVSFGARLLELLPPHASAARLGGDEFAVLIPDSLTSDELIDSLATLHDSLTEPHEVEGFPLSVSVSIGVAVAPQDGSNPQDLMAAADLAMYRSKQSDARVAFHGSTATGGAGRIDLLAELAVAIGNDELEAHYQPQIDLATGALDTVEALVRWDHPRRGLIPPDDFVGLAEQTDLIDALTEWMLRRSMRDLRSLDLPDLRLAVNVSQRSLRQRTFAALVLRCVESSGLSPRRLELEITERAIANDTERTALTIQALRREGVQIAIDDFGTGYSSFGALRHIRADRLKIDRQFTWAVDHSPDDQLVVKTIADLGHGLGLKVVAEGVESHSSRDMLRKLGCDYAQGFAIARPMPVDELRVLVESWSCDRRIGALL